MTKEKRIRMEKKFLLLIEKMNLPSQRRIISDVNLKWFLRNGAIYNRDHKEIFDAIHLAKQLLKQKEFLAQ